MFRKFFFFLVQTSFSYFFKDFPFMATLFIIPEFNSILRKAFFIHVNLGHEKLDQKKKKKISICSISHVRLGEGANRCSDRGAKGAHGQTHGERDRVWDYNLLFDVWFDGDEREFGPLKAKHLSPFFIFFFFSPNSIPFSPTPELSRAFQAEDGILKCMGLYMNDK